MHSDADCPVLVHSVRVRWEVHPPDGLVWHELNCCCIGWRALSFNGQSITKCDGSPHLKHTCSWLLWSISCSLLELLGISCWWGRSRCQILLVGGQRLLLLLRLRRIILRTSRSNHTQILLYGEPQCFNGRWRFYVLLRTSVHQCKVPFHLKVLYDVPSLLRWGIPDFASPQGQRGIAYILPHCSGYVFEIAVVCGFYKISFGIGALEARTLSLRCPTRLT